MVETDLKLAYNHKKLGWTRCDWNSTVIQDEIHELELYWSSTSRQGPIKNRGHNKIEVWNNIHPNSEKIRNTIEKSRFKIVWVCEKNKK